MFLAIVLKRCSFILYHAYVSCTVKQLSMLLEYILLRVALLLLLCWIVFSKRFSRNTADVRDGDIKKKEQTLRTEETVKYQTEKSEPKENTAVEISKESEKPQNIKEKETKKITDMPAETKGDLLVKDKKPSFGQQIQEQNTSSRPQQKFGWMKPEPRPLKLPGGRRWRRPCEEYTEEQIAETILAHSELIQGKTMGINFMKYEKPLPPLDHLQHSEVYKLIHNVDQTPPKRVDFLRTAIAEADYRERCRSLSPCPPESSQEQKSTFLQFQP